MFCWRLYNDQQHLASIVAPGSSSSNSIRAVGTAVPVVVVVVEIAATMIMTCTEQNLSQILLDNMRCVGFCSLVTTASSMPGSLNKSQNYVTEDFKSDLSAKA